MESITNGRVRKGNGDALDLHGRRLASTRLDVLFGLFQFGLERLELRFELLVLDDHVLELFEVARERRRDARRQRPFSVLERHQERRKLVVDGAGAHLAPGVSHGGASFKFVEELIHLERFQINEC